MRARGSKEVFSFSDEFDALYRATQADDTKFFSRNCHVETIIDRSPDFGVRLCNPECARALANPGLSYAGKTGGGAGKNLGRAVVVTANDGGAAWTPDEGNTWSTLPGLTGYWAVAFASPKAGWLVGTEGRIL